MAILRDRCVKKKPSVSKHTHSSVQTHSEDASITTIQAGINNNDMNKATPHISQNTPVT